MHLYIYIEDSHTKLYLQINLAGNISRLVLSAQPLFINALDEIEERFYHAVPESIWVV
jgi:hypothetical protein